MRQLLRLAWLLAALLPAAAIQAHSWCQEALTRVVAASPGQPFHVDDGRFADEMAGFLARNEFKAGQLKAYVRYLKTRRAVVARAHLLNGLHPATNGHIVNLLEEDTYPRSFVPMTRFLGWANTSLPSSSKNYAELRRCLIARGRVLGQPMDQMDWQQFVPYTRTTLFRVKSDETGLVHIQQLINGSELIAVTQQLSTLWDDVILAPLPQEAFEKIAHFEWLWMGANPTGRSGAGIGDVLSLALQKTRGLRPRPAFENRDFAVFCAADFESYQRQRVRELWALTR